MAVLNRRNRRERGVAALEFAIVAPMMVGLFGFFFGFVMAEWTQFKLGSLAQFAVRTCVAQQASTGQTAALQGCMTAITQSQYASMNEHFCDTPIVATPVPAQVLSAHLPRPTSLVGIKLSCRRNMLSWIQTVVPGLASVELHAQAAMPFTP